MQLVPMSFESHGAMAPETIQYIRQLAQCAESNEVCASRDVDMHARMALSVALQVSNSRLVASNVHHGRRRRQHHDTPSRSFHASSAVPSSSSFREATAAAAESDRMAMALDESSGGVASEEGKGDHEGGEHGMHSTPSAASASGSGSTMAWSHALAQVLEDAARTEADGEGEDDADYVPAHSTSAFQLAVSPRRRNRSRTAKRARAEQYFTPPRTPSSAAPRTPSSSSSSPPPPPSPSPSPPTSTSTPARSCSLSLRMDIASSPSQ